MNKHNTWPHEHLCNTLPKNQKTFPTITPFQTHTFITSREGTAICSQICRHFPTVKCCNFLLLCSRIGTEIEMCSPLVAPWSNHPHDLYLETCSWYCSVLFWKIILDRGWLAYVCLVDHKALVCCCSIFPQTGSFMCSKVWQALAFW